MSMSQTFAAYIIPSAKPMPIQGGGAVKKIVALCLLLFAGTSYAGPFGLQMGTKLEDLQKRFTLMPDGPFRYSISNVPQPHKDFQSYSVVVTPTHGLCKVSAVSKIIDSSAFGTELKEKFLEIETALRQKYGAALRQDELQPGSTWKNPRDWMTSLAKKERSLAAAWSSRLTKLPDGLYGIVLEAHAGDESYGALVLIYEFENFNSCAAVLREADNAPL